MNKIYKIIWNHTRQCYVVVAEIARNRGKNNVRTIVEGLAAHSLSRAGRWALPFVTAGVLLLPLSGWASTVTDKSGKSIVNGTGVHDIYAQELVTNSNVDLAVNRFQDYKITQGDIANMYFRLNKTGTDAANLVNLVKNRIDVQGTVNAIKGNQIGGNMFFISPNGMAVGPTGVINAGRFAALAPTSSYFSGDLGTEGIWNSNANLAYQFKNDISNLKTEIGEKIGQTGKKVIDIISISLFPVFMFVFFLLQVINGANLMGPTGWVIAILSMVGCLAFAVFYIIHRCASSKLVTRLTYLFASIFALILLLNVLFEFSGNPYAIDDIVIALVIMYIVFAYMLFNSLGKMEEDSAPKQEEPQEKTKEVDVE